MAERVPACLQIKLLSIYLLELVPIWGLAQLTTTQSQYQLHSVAPGPSGKGIPPAASTEKLPPGVRQTLNGS